MEHPASPLGNATSIFPNSMDLLMMVPRLLQRAGSFAEHMDTMFGKLRNGGSVIAEPTTSQIVNATITRIGTFAQESLAAAATSALRDQDEPPEIGFFQTLKSVGGFFSYMTSKWAIATFVTFYASSRVPITLNKWYLRLTLYLLPTVIFLYRIQWILQAIQCQTSPGWSEMQYGSSGKGLDTDFAGEGGFLWKMSSALLLGQGDEASCRAANMLPPDMSTPRPSGSLSLLWPLFISLGFSQFIETLACALQSRQPSPETGMTIFEHSLAFAEAEAVITNPLGPDLFRPLPAKTITTLDGTSLVLSGAAAVQFANVPPEVLVISLISSLSHFSSNILAITGLRARVRLVSTGIWGLCYLSAFVWAFVRATNLIGDKDTQVGILRFPTICIVGFIPHLLIMVGILACGLVYALAFILTAMAVPSGHEDAASLSGRLRFAYQNLQANIHLSTITPIRINWQEDFYTFILKFGFTVLTAASEAVYLNEGTRINISPSTWLEEKRFQEAFGRRALLRRQHNALPQELRGDMIADGVSLVDQPELGRRNMPQLSGYAHERKTRGADSTSEASRAVGRDEGVGIQQRRGRWVLTFQFMKGIFWLVTTLYAKVAMTILRKLGIAYSPAWLRNFAGTPNNAKGKKPNVDTKDTQGQSVREFWMVNAEGHLIQPSDTSVDVEAETRRRLEDAGMYQEGSVIRGNGVSGDDLLDSRLYNWWKTGGWWGDIDTSGEYEDVHKDDDTTSVVSMATTTSQDDDAWSVMSRDDLDDGQRTPTQQSFFPRTREGTPVDDPLIDMSRLSRLLDPHSAEEEEEARLLARHLSSEGVMTRSRFQRSVERDQTRLLTSSRYRPAGMQFSAQPTPEEEEKVLEHFILEKRNSKPFASASSKVASWNDGAEGMGSEGPQCVVCQLSPRTILVWPCGCLSLCDDCRVGLASKNYTTCVCCRTNVVAYSRFFSPNYMQSGPSNDSQNNFTQEPTQDDQNPSQHGRLPDDDPASPLSLDGERRVPDQPRGEVARDGAAPSHSRDAADPHESARLSQTSPSPGSRIEEYENSAAQLIRKKSDGPVFEVIKKARTPDDKRSPITNLPNEILTHALSHLSPNDLSAVSLVSRRFNDLVTTPHAWRVAFARYFPGPESLKEQSAQLALEDTGEILRSEKRSFARLTALASWRSEYILRTRLLRSLTRGKPVQTPTSLAAARAGQSQAASPIVMYNAQTFTTVNHIHATFGSGLNKRLPRFIHGSDDVGAASSSDPSACKVDSWGMSDPEFFAQFAERFPGDAQWGLGPGDVIGCPNVMDVSQPHGMVYGIGFDGGFVYYRPIEEQRGRFIAPASELSMPNLGIPRMPTVSGAITAVWIAKTATIPSLSEGLVGIMTGSANGVVTACSLGSDGLRSHRMQRGELTARWCLSPGVPIIAIDVDESYSFKRQAQNRIWAVALNALGEVFYLTKFPTRGTLPKDNIAPDNATECLAWVTGRSVYWGLVEPSRRAARFNPYSDSDIDGSYSPRSSWDGMCLSLEQIRSETKEIQQFLRKKPKDFRKSCNGWDMRRRLEVDFAGDDGNYAGEAIVVFECGIEEDDNACVKRFTRCKVQDKDNTGTTSRPSELHEPISLFGRASTPETTFKQPLGQRLRSSSYVSTSSSPERGTLVEEWRCSTLSFGGFRNIELTTTTLDSSTFATLTLSEDPVLGFSTASNASSPYASPQSAMSQPSSPSDIPGQRARFVAAGTKTGCILIWDIRAPVSRSSEIINMIEPIRIIYTESPEISSLAMTALYLVHGGNDGLVQAWDPLASSTQPIRTLNSRFSSRARRRLVQAQTSVQGVGINMFAAGAIVLDPDPTVLRGMVSLGTQLRYWSFSSTAADQYRSQKRRLRRSARGSNNGGERFAGTGRAGIKDFIANEAYELEREKESRHRRANQLAKRFGVDLLGSEEEALAYAALLSQESLEEDRRKRSESGGTSALRSNTVTPEASVSGNVADTSGRGDTEAAIDDDLAEAIRRSLEESDGGLVSPSAYFRDHPIPGGSAGFDIPVRYAKARRSPTSRSRSSPVLETVGSASASAEMDDLEYALQLSLAEEESKMIASAVAEEDEFPALSPSPKGKGKGKRRA
ncbi:hypothetical protein BU16DRAFT_583157 [Lophium mytilinum]|uniref:F-box domain-containing protein n=1 Tax=Lophium mytilinum TaxID=390894 RepID=A0A6A6QPY5_9PEZI|nr:hypothetical protein BU16DRAFT_583157 [Lophium mytilinum]